MGKPITHEETASIEEDFPDLVMDILEIISEIVYWSCWSTYEEHAGIFIFKAFDDSYQKIEFGYCVFGDPPNYQSEIEEISKEEVGEEIAEMEKMINSDEF